MAKQGRPIPVTFLCVKCRYDLTNVARNICPACGAEFDRRELLRKLGREPHVGPKIATILAIAPILYVLATLLMKVMSIAPAEPTHLLMLLLVYVIAAAAPIASTRLVFYEVSELYKHWAQDAQSRFVLGSAIFIVLAVIEGAFMVTAYFLCYLVFGL